MSKRYYIEKRLTKDNREEDSEVSNLNHVKAPVLKRRVSALFKRLARCVHSEDKLSNE